MLKFKTIVGATCMSLLLVVAACGQKGPLTLPKEPAAQNRATLPQVLNPTAPASTPAATPTATPAASPTTPPASAPTR